jgi:hypothetical protein
MLVRTTPRERAAKVNGEGFIIVIKNFYFWSSFYIVEKALGVARARSSVWLEHPAHNRGAMGSSPFGPIIFLFTINFFLILTSLPWSIEGLIPIPIESL